MRDITGTTLLCGLLGNPVEHSLSPMIHNNLAFYTNTDMAYSCFQVEETCLKAAVDGAFALGFKGLNVTVPHKTAVMPFLCGIDPLAEAIGAVNTLVRKENGFYGYNTDILGFIRELEENEFSIKDRDVVILGAGGVARAIAFACANEGAAKIYILNRTMDKAEAIATDINNYFGFSPSERVLAVELSASEYLNSKDFLLVQTTSVGMYPNVSETLLEDSSLYEKAAFGFDVIYNPYDTVFMKKLRRAGKNAVNGLPMLLYQGVEAYKMWFKDVQVNKNNERDIFYRLRNALSPVSFERKAKVQSPNKCNIILIGFMGSGKTTLGKWISKHTGRVYIDTDKEIEFKAGMSISEIFEKQGEEAFRQMETDYLKELAESGNNNMVLSVGGGTVLREENRNILKSLGTVVYLKASVDELANRLRYDERRPLLQGKTGDERRQLIAEMLGNRESAYSSAAHFIITTDGVYFPRIYQIIYKKLREERYCSSRKKKNNHTDKARNNGGYGRGYNKNVKMTSRKNKYRE